MKLGINPTEVWAATAVPGFKAGQYGSDDDGSEFVFVKADATGLTGAGYVCFIAAAGVASMITTTTSTPGTNSAQPVGVAMAAVAANGWGWLCVRGIDISVRVAASAVKGTVLNTTAAAGTIDDDATVGAEVIQGLCITTTNGGAAGNQPGNLMYPSIGRTL